MKIPALLAACALAVMVSAAQPPTPEALAALAPRLALSEPAVTNFTVRGAIDAGPFRLRFGFTAARPDSAILSLVDPRDGTPLLFGAGGRVLLYDPLAEEMIVASAWPSMKLELETPDPATTNAAKVNFHFGFQQNRTNAVSVVDLAALARHAAKDRAVAEESPGRYRFSSHTKDGGGLRAFVEPGRAEGAWSRMELNTPEEPDRPALVLDDLRINTVLAPGTFDFPLQAVRNSGIKVRELESGGFFRGMLDMGRVMKALATRVALTLPQEDREELAGKLLLRGVDWDAVRARDAQTGAVLRKILPPAP